MVKTPRLEHVELVCPDSSLSEFRVYERGKNGWLNRLVLGTYLVKSTYSFRDGKVDVGSLKKEDVFRWPGVLERALYAILIPDDEPLRKDVRREKEGWLSDMSRDRERNIRGLFVYAVDHNLSSGFIVDAFIAAGFPVEKVRHSVDGHTLRVLLKDA